MRELRAKAIGPVAKRQRCPLGVAADHRRQLEEVADENYLEPAERGGRSPDMAANGIDQA